MTLRGKIWAAQAPLALALIVVGLFSWWALSALAARSRQILESNDRSVQAAQRMSGAAQHIQSAALRLALASDEPADAEIRAAQAAFQQELDIQQHNITEPGEQAVTDHLAAEWHDLEPRLEQYRQSSPPEARRSAYFATLEPACQAIERDATRIVEINRQAMLNRSAEAERLAAGTSLTLILIGVASLLAGGLVSVVQTNHVLRPLAELQRTVGRLSRGDFDARAVVPGDHEITALADQFNALAARLSEYTHSSLGELLLAQRTSQAAIDSIPDPVIVLDGSRILNINAAAAALVSPDQDWPPEMLGRFPPGLRAQLDRAAAHVLRGHGPYLPSGLEAAFAVATPSGERWFLLRGNPVCDNQRQAAAATLTLQDVTRLRQFDEMKNDFVATVAHEFRTPLTSLRMAIHLCLEGVVGPLSDKQQDLLHAAREDCERLQRLVDELLDLARIQAGTIALEVSPTTPAELVGAALRSSKSRAQEKQIELKSDFRSRTGKVLADRERIQLVFSNLLGNALRHTPAGGSVQINVQSQDGVVRFEVADSGEGIPPEYQAAIFERFFRVPRPSSGAIGLGLPLAREIVAAHQGTMGVCSTPGEGSTFWFTLPQTGGEPGS